MSSSPRFFSIYDARRAGFEKVVFIIKKDNEEEFKEVIGNRKANLWMLPMHFRNFRTFLKIIRFQMGEKNRGELLMQCLARLIK